MSDYHATCPDCGMFICQCETGRDECHHGTGFDRRCDACEDEDDPRDYNPESDPKKYYQREEE